MANQEPSASEPVRQPPRLRHSRHGTPHRCQVCGNSYTAHNVLPAALVRDNLAEIIAAHVPNWDHGGFI